MENFMEIMNLYLGESSDSPSISDLNDEEGKAIAKKLNAKYLGWKPDYNVYWFNDKKYDSSYVGRTLEDATENKKKLWQRFQ